MGREEGRGMSGKGGGEGQEGKGRRGGARGVREDRRGRRGEGEVIYRKRKRWKETKE